MRYDAHIAYSPASGLAPCVLRALPAIEAASLAMLDPTEVEWAVAEFGRCDAEHPTSGRTVAIVPAGAPAPAPLEAE